MAVAFAEDESLNKETCFIVLGPIAVIVRTMGLRWGTLHGLLEG